MKEELLRRGPLFDRRSSRGVHFQPALRGSLSTGLDTAWPPVGLTHVSTGPGCAASSTFDTPWSFPWSLSERISHHLRASQGRSHAVRDLRTSPGRGSSGVLGDTQN